jgi:hypothetical protein
MEDRDIAARGEISRDEIDHHGEGFEKEFDKAPRELDGSKYAGQELEVQALLERSLAWQTLRKS